MTIAFTEAAYAQGAINTLGPLTDMSQIFLNRASSWEDGLETDARNLFNILVIIEIVWTVGWGLLSGVEFVGLLALIARQIITIGFFAYLLEGGARFTNAIIDSFTQASVTARSASGGITQIQPQDIVSSGFYIVSQMLQGLSIANIGLDLLLVVASVIILFALVKVAAIYLETMVEAAFVAYAGVILLGFGGTSFTRTFTISYYRWAVSVGLKKMFILLIVGLGMGVMQSLAQIVPAAMADNWEDICILIGAPLLYWQIAERLPYKAQEVISGTSLHGPGTLLDKAAAIGRAAGAAAVASAGSVTAAGAAFNLAQKQLSGGEDGGGGGSSGRGGSGGTGGGGSNTGGGGGSSRGSIAKQAVRNFGGAMANDIGMRLTGDHTARLLNSGWRMAKSMNDEADNLDKG